MAALEAVDGPTTIEGMADEQDHVGAVLKGTEDQLSFDLGSAYQVNQSTLKVKAIPDLTVSGQYRDGDTVRLVVEVEIDKVHFNSIRDKHGQKLGIQRHHVAQVLGVETAA